jgi:glycosyltransferase involved in cell wall biosynthesis
MYQHQAAPPVKTRLCSVITPTWHRHKYLLERCIPSVRAQAYPAVEHIICSDGPDPDLLGKLCAELEYGGSPVVLSQMECRREEKHWGAAVRREALHHASGGFIAYLDDDDALRPEHLALHVDALTRNPDAGFSLSQMMVHNNWNGPPEIIGSSGLMQQGHLGTPMIVHRRELLQIATWEEDHYLEDWNLVSAWLKADVSYVRINAITVDVWPGRYRYGEE